MDLLNKAARLEKKLLRRLTGRTGVARQPIEIYEAVLEDIEERIEPAASGTTFPYTHVRVVVLTSDVARRAAADAVFSQDPGFQARIVRRLLSAGCEVGSRLTAVVEYVDQAPPEWEGRDYHIEYERAATRSVRKPRSTKIEVPSTELAVVRGEASRRKYTFTAARINIGRLAEVRDRDDRVLRENHVDFADSDRTPNNTVSRAHAHIVFDEEKNTFRIHDDGSSHGTSIVRRGATIEVPRSGSRGVTLRHGDELLIGSARLRFQVK